MESWVRLRRWGIPEPWMYVHKSQPNTQRLCIRCLVYVCECELRLCGVVYEREPERFSWVE